jgi:hypothetical protein
MSLGEVIRLGRANMRRGTIRIFFTNMLCSQTRTIYVYIYIYIYIVLASKTNSSSKITVSALSLGSYRTLFIYADCYSRLGVSGTSCRRARVVRLLHPVARRHPCHWLIPCFMRSWFVLRLHFVSFFSFNTSFSSSLPLAFFKVN